MKLTFIWESFLLLTSGIFLLRLAGRKSLSQMTLAQTILMISIGTIIVQPIIGKGVMKTIIVAAIFVITIEIIEYLVLKFNTMEKFITGKSKIVIENGKLNVQNLKKLRLTIDLLEMRLRNAGISKIEDVKFATIEPNGLLGYELNDDARPLTVGEFKKYLELHFSLPKIVDQNKNHTQMNETIFEEIKSSKPQNHPEYLS